MTVHSAAVNVRADAHKLRPGSAPYIRFECRRCHRDLPEAQFQPLWTSRGSGRLGTVIFLHPICWVCRKQAKSRWAHEPLYSPGLHRFVTKLILSSSSGATVRGMIFAIRADDVIERYIGQNGKCALSGVRMAAKSGGTAISIDRIDGDGNYTRDNIQLVCAELNIARGTLSVDRFVEWCARVALHHARS